MHNITPLILSIACASTALAEANVAESPPLLDRAKETAAALSACPKATAAGAGAYVLERAGYVKVRDSQNGFTAMVHRTLPTSFEPQCLDAEGTRTRLPVYLKEAELRAQGKTRAEI